jgi:transposase
VLEGIEFEYPLLQKIWADGGYRGQLIGWVVERTFGWFNRFRRLSKDYEELPRNSESLIYLAMTHIMVRRLGA